MSARTSRLLLALAVTVGLTATACSSPSDGPDTGGKSSGSVPRADVVAAVRTDSALHARLPTTVRAQRVLTFGTTLLPGTSNLPYSGSVGGKTVGLHVDLANAVAKVLGVHANLVNGTFPTIVPGVQNGKFDVGLANLAVTAEREKTLDYATYLTDGQSFLGSRSTTLRKVTRLSDLCGLTIATSPGSTFQQILQDGRNDCAKAGRKPYTVQYFSTSAPILLGLSNGKVDVEFGPTLSVKYDAAHIAGTHFLGQISSTPVGFVTPKHSSLVFVLRDAVNVLIRSGVYARILAKWGVTASGITKSVINPKPSL